MKPQTESMISHVIRKYTLDRPMAKAVALAERKGHAVSTSCEWREVIAHGHFGVATSCARCGSDVIVTGFGISGQALSDYCPRRVASTETE